MDEPCWAARHDEDVPGSSVAVVGFGLWQRVFGGDPAVIGRHLTIDGEAHVVIGVMSADFQPMERFFSRTLHSTSTNKMSISGWDQRLSRKYLKT